MIESEQDLPEELYKSLQKLLFSLPRTIREDPITHQEILLYLKIGGEKLARQHITTITIPFNTRFELVRKRIIEEEELVVEDEGEENEEEQDDDMIDDPDSLHDHSAEFDSSDDFGGDLL